MRRNSSNSSWGGYRSRLRSNADRAKRSYYKNLRTYNPWDDIENDRNPRGWDLKEDEE